MLIIPEFNNTEIENIETYNGTILTLKDALLILEATRLGILSKVKRRLNGLERKYIKSNKIFAWNETECGMKRWTDGKNWSASKVSGPFLVYKELDENKNVKLDGLVKQSFSLITKQNQKLHLISYTDPANQDSTLTPSNDPKLKHISLTNEIYQDGLLDYPDLNLGMPQSKDTNILMSTTSYPPSKLPKDQSNYKQHFMQQINPSIHSNILSITHPIGQHVNPSPISLYSTPPPPLPFINNSPVLSNPQLIIQSAQYDSSPIISNIYIGTPPLISHQVQRSKVLNLANKLPPLPMTSNDSSNDLITPNIYPPTRRSFHNYNDDDNQALKVLDKVFSTTSSK